MTRDQPDITDAYALQTPDDSRRLYADWAGTYDSGFVDANRYELHLHVARLFAEAGGEGPVLDVGAGTGICGAALADLGLAPVDGTDISAEMLAQAARKRVYRRLFTGDVTGVMDAPEVPYAGIVSSGTFTTGHVGPDAIDNLLAIAAPRALFALSVNARHFESAGFAVKLEGLAPQITDLSLPEVAIYGAGAEGPHKDDTALVALFRKR